MLNHLRANTVWRKIQFSLCIGEMKRRQRSKSLLLYWNCGVTLLLSTSFKKVKLTTWISFQSLLNIITISITDCLPRCPVTLLMAFLVYFRHTFSKPRTKMYSIASYQSWNLVAAFVIFFASFFSFFFTLPVTLTHPSMSGSDSVQVTAVSLLSVEFLFIWSPMPTAVTSCKDRS